MAEPEKLQKFLNNECIWIRNDRSCTKYVQVYNASTAISPYFKPSLTSGTGGHALNITCMIVKPKKKRPVVTVYINDSLINCCTCELVAIRKINWRKLFLIYFGSMVSHRGNFGVLANNTYPLPPIPDLTKHETIHLGIPITNLESMNTQNFKPVGVCAWFGENVIYQHFMNPDLMLLFPAVTEFPTLARVLCLLSRCENQECVPCHGLKIHAKTYQGFTPNDSDGKCHACPCITSCNALKSGMIPITGNRNLLSLLFDPDHQAAIEQLYLVASPYPVPPSNFVFGVTKRGTQIPANNTHWTLFCFPELHSRVMIYSCQILKRMCLRFY